MKPLFPKFHQQAWDEHKKQSNRKLGRIFTLLLFMCSFLMIGGIAQPKSKAGASLTAVASAASMVALPWAKKQGSAFRLYKEEDLPEGGTLSEEAEKALITKVKGVVNDAITKAKEGGATPEDIKKLTTFFDVVETAEQKSLSMKDLAEMKKNLEELGLKVKGFTEKGSNPDQTGSLYDQTVKGLTDNKEALAAMKDIKGSKSVQIEIKAAGTMTTGNVTPTTPGGISPILNQNEPGITGIPRSAPFFVELLNSFPTTGKTVSYAEMKNPDGGAGMTAEGAAKSQADFDIVEAQATVRKITAYIKASREALEDIDQLAAEINGELITLVNLKADSQALVGDGTGQNLLGVYTAAPTFVAPTNLALNIPAANNFDVLAAAVAQVMTAEVIAGEPAGFMPTAIIMNTLDMVEMKLTKDLNGQYLFPVILPGVSTVINVPIITNPRMAQGTFLVGDMKKANLRPRKALEILIGYENDDFTKNLVTILAEMRMALYIKSNHLKAFVKGSFATAKAALTQPT